MPPGLIELDDVGQQQSIRHGLERMLDQHVGFVVGRGVDTADGPRRK
jgi:hypothetical protein